MTLSLVGDNQTYNCFYFLTLVKAQTGGYASFLLSNDNINKSGQDIAPLQQTYKKPFSLFPKNLSEVFLILNSFTTEEQFQSE